MPLQTIIKQESDLYEWYYHALQPWVHYVPTGYNGIPLDHDDKGKNETDAQEAGTVEIDRIVLFLRDHDHLARSIAANAQRFAATHLTSEGRYCYIKVGGLSKGGMGRACRQASRRAKQAGESGGQALEGMISLPMHSFTLQAYKGVREAGGKLFSCSCRCEQATHPLFAP